MTVNEAETVNETKVVNEVTIDEPSTSVEEASLKKKANLKVTETSESKPSYMATNGSCDVFTVYNSSVTAQELKIIYALKDFCLDYLILANKKIIPSKQKPSVRTVSGVTVMEYVEFDVTKLDVELRKPKKKQSVSYYAKFRYMERTYQREVKTDGTLSSPRVISSRRVVELPRYKKGQWIH